MKNTLFVTGTDTGVGKTVVCAALILALRQRGLRAGYLKPLCSGCQLTGEGLLSPDVAFVRATCGLTDPLDLISPIRLEAPLSPLAAAEIQGVSIDTGVLDDVFQKMSQRHDVVIVEGVGGLLVPVTPQSTVADLAADWGFPALVVARPSLGTINHTLLTLGHLASREIDCLGFVFCGPGQDESSDRNAELIARFSGLPFLGAVGEVKGLDTDAACPGFLEESLSDLDVETLLERLGP